MVGPDAAADVTQDAFLRAWTDVRSLRDPERFGPWLRQILVNRCRDLVRARQRVRVLSLEADPRAGERSVAPDPSSAIAQLADLQWALGALALEQRAILALHYLADLPIRDVAHALGVPEGTAKSRLHSAMLELRRVLREAAR